MDLKLSVEKLPDPVRQLIQSEPTIKSRLDGGEKLEAILRNREWAEEWLEHSADFYQLEGLKKIVVRYAGLPFEIDSLIKATGEENVLTGAETRVAVAKLRRSGIVHSVRKAWGDQLLYLPEDTVPMWLPLLFPIIHSPLNEAAKLEISYASKEYRLPLSLELLAAWQQFDRQPMTWTVKGRLHRHPFVRMQSGLRITSQELADLTITYPNNDQLPAYAALALDLGLRSKVLRRQNNEIRLSMSGLSAWLALEPTEADSRLHDWIMTRIGESDPAIHITASALSAINGLDWHEDHCLAVTIGQEKAIELWLGLMESFGWLERGSYRDGKVFRKKYSKRSANDQTTPESASMFVQPDGEIFVPPATSLKQRWVLSEIAELVTADELVVYQLTRNACIKAFQAGHTFQSVISFLEQGAAIPLPEPVTGALADWFSPLGKVVFADVLLLRAINPEVADHLKQNPEIAELLLEHVGDRDFIIDRESYPDMLARLQKIGYPAQTVDQALSRKHEIMPPVPPDDEFSEEEQGWIYRRQALSAFTADRAIPGTEELFPGISSVPAAWLSKPRTYHASTSKEVIQRAIDWQTSIRLEVNGAERTFHPKNFRDEGEKWSVLGQWKVDPGNDVMNVRPETVSILADEISEVMIVLPALEELETH
ncbi:helicase-associated domain-containing protein [Cohnella lupini]|uniref:XPB/Ssl2-like helicase family protein n=1 Tax=Cohnella lupini TaxID=1294267 RepID=A0A3D9IW18_9BACL|nr:helicase-associated domain-containing protein [Cohnella lupini]RED65895.1 XPB/Ssl2-like helicase family protein [Cohnella lupini]